MAICNDIIKSRDIRFKAGHHARQTAYTTDLAIELLRDASGIAGVSTLNAHRIRVEYDVRQLTLQTIEAALVEVGFVLDHGLLQQMKRAIFAYCEDALRERLSIDQSSSEQLKISLPQNFTQDPRPDNWRNYS